ncbi:hypothetical protein [Mycobacterium servetii]|uniref:Uncharacterized protein n=1 Tax=Mycobacterium servetii TaxID=3237418 RepID=A0ABV4C4M4_9MYCO
MSDNGSPLRGYLDAELVDYAHAGEEMRHLGALPIPIRLMACAGSFGDFGEGQQSDVGHRPPRRKCGVYITEHLGGFAVKSDRCWCPAPQLPALGAQLETNSRSTIRLSTGVRRERLTPVRDRVDFLAFDAATPPHHRNPSASRPSSSTTLTGRTER